MIFGAINELGGRANIVGGWENSWEALVGC